MQHARRLTNGRVDRVEVEGAAGRKLDLPVPHAKVGERAAQPVAGAAAQPDDLLKRVIWRTAHPEQLLPGPQHAVERARDGVRAREALHAHERRLGAQQLRVDRVERLAPEVAVAISINTIEVVRADAVAPEGGEDAREPLLSMPIDGRKRRPQLMYGRVDHCVSTG